MFTGLIAGVGKLVHSEKKGGARRLTIDISCLSHNPQVGDSIAINGTCLTITTIDDKGIATFDAVEETVRQTNLHLLTSGKMVNLEPAMRLDGRLDGHIVQGHVDATGKIISVTPQGQGQIWTFSLPASIAKFVAKKGSIAINGISLTVAEVSDTNFTVSLIPHTIANTALQYARPGDTVNLEADVLARYISRRFEQTETSTITEDFLRDNGFM